MTHDTSTLNREWPVNPSDDSLASVGATNFTGGVQATTHLLGLGHRRIGFAGGRELSVVTRERLQGFLSVMRAERIPVPDELILEDTFSFDSGLSMGLQLLELPEPPTAIFAASDGAALGVVEAARRLGASVPEDLSVVGFDDTYSAMPVSPALTTVRQPLPEMGRLALRTVLQLHRGERPDSHHVLLSTQLIERASTAPPCSRSGA